MGGPPRDGFEDEEVEGPAEDFDGRFGHAATPIGFLGGSIVCDSPRKSMGRPGDWGLRGLETASAVTTLIPDPWPLPPRVRAPAAIDIKYRDCCCRHRPRPKTEPFAPSGSLFLNVLFRSNVSCPRVSISESLKTVWPSSVSNNPHAHGLPQQPMIPNSKRAHLNCDQWDHSIEQTNDIQVAAGNVFRNDHRRVIIAADREPR